MPIISVLPDVPALDRPFDYLFEGELPVGTIVRVPLGARRVRGWVLGVDPTSSVDHDRQLLNISKVVGRGPTDDVIELCRWSAWRWSGRLVSMLRIASPDRVVPLAPGRGRPTTARASGRKPPPVVDPSLVELVGSILRSEPVTSILRSSPLTDPLDVVIGALDVGQVIVVSPSPVEVDRIVTRLRSHGIRVAAWPHDWAAAAGAAVVVGTRSAVFAPTSALAGLVVVDEHDPLLQSESSPTWNAREVAVERARRAGVPCLLVSPCPSLEAFRAQQATMLLNPVDDATTAAFTVSRSATRDGWARLRVIDRRGEDVRRSGLFSSELVTAMRDALEEGRPVTCVLNRTGRARLLACRSCSTIVRCHECGSAMTQRDDTVLICGSCGAQRPAVCAECGSSALALIRPGVSRAREELEALLRVPVDQVTGGAMTDDRPLGSMARIGTTAVLSSRTSGGLVAFVDFDQELLARRYRAAEDALGLLMSASRMVDGRRSGGGIVVQTRIPEHEVLMAVNRADPRIVANSEMTRRKMLGLPPVGSVAWVAGEAADGYVANLTELGTPDGLAITSAAEGEWLLRSTVPARLQDALSSVRRPVGRLRLQVDPHRLGR